MIMSILPGADEYQSVIHRSVQSESLRGIFIFHSFVGGFYWSCQKKPRSTGFCIKVLRVWISLLYATLGLISCMSLPHHKIFLMEMQELTMNSVGPRLRGGFWEKWWGAFTPTWRIPTKIAVVVGFHPKLTVEVIFWPNINIKYIL